jgi:predicted nucleotide-binding protein
MAGRRSAPTPPPEPPLALRVPRADAADRVSHQIDKGRALLGLGIRSQAELEHARAEASKWESYTEELLKRLFTNESIAREFMRFCGSVGYVDDGLAEFVARLREDVKGHVGRLDSILARLELLDEPPSVTAPKTGRERMTQTRDVFVVHGNNEAVRESTCRFLEKLDLRPIVLHEQANRGKTIIEKFEAHSNVEFAVVLLTADDVGAAKDKPDALRPRARQNVILELGYFLSRLGRHRVCCLYEHGVEVPSDYDGVIYVPLEGDGWRLSLARELKSAGINVDLNNAV